MSNNNKYSYIAEVKAEIRRATIEKGSFKKDNGDDVEYSTIVIKALDEDDNSFFIKDKRIENIEKYTRGTVGVFKIRIDVVEGFKGKTTITLIDFVAEK